MRVETPAAKRKIVDAFAKGSCPICSVLREFQNSLAENVQPEAIQRLCNQHTWALARDGDALAVCEVFLSAMDANSESSGSSHTCSHCLAMRNEIEERLTEFLAEMRRSSSRSWMAEYGCLCLRHAEELRARADEPLRTLIEDIVKRNKSELQQQLADYGHRVKQGQHAGGGLLGRAAEFLVGQRGV